MSERTAKFTFNCAVTATFKADDEFDQAAHREQIAPFHKYVKTQIDGVLKCFIDRFDMEVTYRDEVITPENLFRAIDNYLHIAIRQHGLFPLRGPKTVGIAKVVHASKDPQPTTYRTLTATFNTHVLAYPVNTDGAFDRRAFTESTLELVRQLTNTDGIVKCDLELSYVCVEYNSSITTRDNVVEHMENVLNRAAEESNDFFPYWTQALDGLVLKFSDS